MAMNVRHKSRPKTSILKILRKKRGRPSGTARYKWTSPRWIAATTACVRSVTPMRMKITLK